MVELIGVLTMAALIGLLIWGMGSERYVPSADSMAAGASDESADTPHPDELWVRHAA